MVYAKPVASFIVTLVCGVSIFAQVPATRTPAQTAAPTTAPAAKVPLKAATKTSAGTTQKKMPLPPVATKRTLPKYLGVGIMSWQEQIRISGPNGTSYDATAQLYSPSLHYISRGLFSPSEGLVYEGYVLYGKADIQDNTSGVLNYFQKRVSMMGLGAAVGWFYRPEGKQVDIGVSLPVQYRKVDWTEPAGGYTVSKKDVFAVGAVLDFRWLLTPGLALHQRIGGFVGYQSALWMMNLEWTL